MIAVRPTNVAVATFIHRPPSKSVTPPPPPASSCWVSAVCRSSSRAQGNGCQFGQGKGSVLVPRSSNGSHEQWAQPLHRRRRSKTTEDCLKPRVSQGHRRPYSYWAYCVFYAFQESRPQAIGRCPYSYRWWHRRFCPGPTGTGTGTPSFLRFLLLRSCFFGIGIGIGIGIGAGPHRPPDADPWALRTRLSCPPLRLLSLSLVSWGGEEDPEDEGAIQEGPCQEENPGQDEEKEEGVVRRWWNAHESLSKGPAG
mmetsp:Transcript_17166/g.37470  ORF Transcript_17166/g.37470 Transcript_17166/m.37470 type:complete len:253 (-) Transcript_17166:496-1254(-)